MIQELQIMKWIYEPLTIIAILLLLDQTWACQTNNFEQSGWIEDSHRTAFKQVVAVDTSLFAILVNDVRNNIFSFLSPRDRASVKQVSWKFKAYVESLDSVLKNIPPGVRDGRYFYPCTREGFLAHVRDYRGQNVRFTFEIQKSPMRPLDPNNLLELCNWDWNAKLDYSMTEWYEIFYTNMKGQSYSSRGLEITEDQSIRHPQNIDVTKPVTCQIDWGQGMKSLHVEVQAHIKIPKGDEPIEVVRICLKSFPVIVGEPTYKSYEEDRFFIRSIYTYKCEVDKNVLSAEAFIATEMGGH